MTFPGARASRDIARLADEVSALPGRLADLMGRRVAVALDEFQDIARFDGGSIGQALRAAVQHQRRGGYVSPARSPR